MYNFVITLDADGEKLETTAKVSSLETVGQKLPWTQLRETLEATPSSVV